MMTFLVILFHVWYIEIDSYALRRPHLVADWKRKKYSHLEQSNDSKVPLMPYGLYWTFSSHSTDTKNWSNSSISFLRLGYNT